MESATVHPWCLEGYLLCTTHADDACEDIAVGFCFHIDNRTRGVDAVDSVYISDFRKLWHRKLQALVAGKNVFLVYECRIQ